MYKSTTRERYTQKDRDAFGSFLLLFRFTFFCQFFLDFFPFSRTRCFFAHCAKSKRHAMLFDGNGLDDEVVRLAELHFLLHGLYIAEFRDVAQPLDIAAQTDEDAERIE